jgi:hypothetical protein
LAAKIEKDLLESSLFLRPQLLATLRDLGVDAEDLLLIETYDGWILGKGKCSTLIAQRN